MGFLINPFYFMQVPVKNVVTTRRKTRYINYYEQMFRKAS